MDIQEAGWRGMNWIDLVQDREKWRALVNAVTNCGFCKMREISRLTENLLASQEGLCSMEWGSVRDYSARWQDDL